MPQEETLTEVVRTFLEEYLRRFEQSISEIVGEMINKKIAELTAVIEERAKPGPKGDVGPKPLAGVDYPIPPPGLPGVPGTPGKSADETKIVMDVLSRIPKSKPGPKGDPGKDGASIPGEEIVQKINALPIVPEKQIDVAHIRNIISLIKKHSDNGIMLRGGGGITLETPSGTVNGVNTIFDVTMSPKYLVIDGVSKFEDVHYTITNSRITIIDGAPPVQYIRAII